MKRESAERRVRERWSETVSAERGALEGIVVTVQDGCEGSRAA